MRYAPGFVLIIVALFFAAALFHTWATTRPRKRGGPPPQSWGASEGMTTVAETRSPVPDDVMEGPNSARKHP